jgi:hypothetical protein
MTPLPTESINDGGLTRRQLITIGALNLAGLLLPPLRPAAAALQDDLERVARIPRMTERDGPLLVFRDFASDPDVEIEQYIRRQVAQRKDLLSRLKEKIGVKREARLSVEDMAVRLMFVPQLQKGPEAAYRRYCQAVTDYIFEFNGLDNFYGKITIPQRSNPPLAKLGKTAFLVHRLAKAYRAVCRFTAESGRSVRYEVSGSVFSSHLGAVDLEIKCLAPGRFDLRRKPYTIWQNDTENLFTLMAVPVEETLHFCMGRATDRQIAETLRSTSPQSLAEAKKLADDWMAVEESIVGGLVIRVLASYYKRHHLRLPASVAAKMNAPVPTLHQYRYRDRGIQLVKKLGLREAAAMYMDSPSNFKQALFRQQKA